MKKKFYFISYRINVRSRDGIYAQELTDMSPLQYVAYWREIGGHYGDRIILYSEEISSDDYEKYAEIINKEF